MIQDNDPAFKALLKVQQELKPVGKDSTTKIPTKSGKDFGYDYVSFSAILDCPTNS